MYVPIHSKVVAAAAGLFCLCASSGLVQAQTGGPDAFGYVYGPTAYDYIDISESGASHALGDDGEVTVNLPWDFDFYGTAYNELRIGTNGGVSFNPSGNINFSNQCLPWGTGPDISVSWDDSNLTGSAAGIYSYHDTVNDRFIVSWQDLPHYSNTGAASFQLHLVPPNQISMHWADLDYGNSIYDHGASATIGIQDVIGGTYSSNNLQVHCNEWDPNLQGTAVLFSLPDVGDDDDSGDE